ncbi:uncharacterized protein F5147DRAFT_780816 [Suillus discolor]|uniref:Uncharacterized protein n=1 Tax=Suillus discolor TaxID=1912936 RepID=A0A9P7JMF8_9AGAM|nr:uncharacterized protein F5147DRAFT_780816 [Suillus discolor]KAG2088938.1 hypothetical protein F5147DRAFT_780816 [Suillus discolor]
MVLRRKYAGSRLGSCQLEKLQDRIQESTNDFYVIEVCLIKATKMPIALRKPYSQLAQAMVIALSVAFLSFASILVVLSLDYLQRYLNAQ